MTGCQLKATQFVAMFMKRFLNTKRDKKAVITQLIIPILLIILGFILQEYINSYPDETALTLQLSKLLGKKNQDSIHGYYADTRTSVSANEKTRMKDVGVLYFQKHSFYEGLC